MEVKCTNCESGNTRFIGESFACGKCGHLFQKQEDCSSCRWHNRDWLYQCSREGGNCLTKEYQHYEKKITPKEEIQNLKSLLRMAQCPDCDGSGCIMHQVSERQYVSKYMAMDAGDPELEGSLYSDEEWEQEQCRWCYEKNEALEDES